MKKQASKIRYRLVLILAVFFACLLAVLPATVTVFGNSQSKSLLSSDAAAPASDGPPVITSVSPITADINQTITITGSGFGTNPRIAAVGDGSVDTIACNTTTSSLDIHDNGANADSWYAGRTVCGYPDGIGIYIVSWTDTRIVLGGFGAALGNDSYPSTWNIAVGDPIEIDVFGPNNIGEEAPPYTENVASPATIIAPALTAPSSVATSTSAVSTTNVTTPTSETPALTVFAAIAAAAVVITAGAFLFVRRQKATGLVSSPKTTRDSENLEGVTATQQNLLAKQESYPNRAFPEVIGPTVEPMQPTTIGEKGMNPTIHAGAQSETEGASIFSITRTGPTYLVEYRPAGKKTIPLTTRRRVLLDDTMRRGILTKLNELTKRANVLLLITRGKSVGEVGAPLNPFQTLKDLGKVISDYFLFASAIKTIRESKSQNLILETDDTEIPWELMYDGSDFLCMKHYVGRALVVEMDAEVMTPRPREVKKGLRIALVIDPTETLPAAAKEVKLAETLGKLGEVDIYQGKSVDMLRGMQLFSQGYDIIHFAGHAEFDADNPNESSLGFADGKLKAYHIKEMIEKSEVIPRLIFVNACTSARESVETELDYHGYKIKGLASLFLHAGVSGYIGTTWTIFDESAQFLAAEFYERILKGEPVGMALTEARRRTFDNYPEDLSWAAFVLYGNPGAHLF